MIDANFGEKVCLDEAKKAFERQSLSMDRLKDMSKTLFQSASIIVAIIAALKIWGSNATGFTSLAFVALLILSLLSYVSLIYLFVRTLSPTGWNGPIKNDWDVLYGAFGDKEEIDVIRMQISSYLNAFQLNDEILLRFANYVRVESWLLGSTVLLLIIASLLPR
jgi:hypothetical protein